MTLSRATTSVTVYDKIRELQRRIDELKAFYEKHRGNCELIGQLLSEARELDDESPQFRYVVCIN